MVVNWDTAILDAKSEIKIAKQRIRKLQMAIKTFTDNRDNNVPFPNKQSTNDKKSNKH